MIILIDMVMLIVGRYLINPVFRREVCAFNLHLNLLLATARG